MRKIKWIRSILAVFCICGSILAYNATAFAETQEDTICKGIFIESVDVGGMTAEQAAEALHQFIEAARSKQVKIKVGDNTVEATLEDLGYTCDEAAYVEEVLQYGKSGNVIKRYKELKDVEHEPTVYHLEFQLENDVVESFVKKKCAAFDIPAVNASLVRKNGKFEVKEASAGKKVVVDETIEKIKASVLTNWNEDNLVIEAVVNDAEPEYTSEAFEKCKDILGSHYTTYNASSNNRAQNLSNAAKLINGTVVYPGETFSTSEKLVPFTVENGYQVAQAYAQGQVVDSVGGGVCQAATTLYNALLKAEVEIVERYNHSMIVGYVDPSMDAAISEGYKDLKFKNNTDVPMYIEAYTEGRKITFNIYGEETRDAKKRSVKYVSEVLETIQPGADKVTIDSTKPENYLSVTQSAHVGYKAQLWKVITEDGVEVSREKVNYSYYAAEPRYVVKGGEKGDTKATKEPAGKATQKPKATKNPKATKAPVVTKEPKPTKKPSPTKAPKPTQEPTNQDEEE